MTDETTPKQAVDAMADIDFEQAWHQAGGIEDVARRLRIEFALRLRRDGLAYIRERLGTGTAGVLELLLAVTADAAYPRADQLNATLTAPLDGMVDAIPVACHAGCSACCHLTVEVTIPEAILVARGLADPGHPHREAVLASDRIFAGLNIAQRLRTGRPCPLLRPDKSCAVYSVRPLACRGFMAPDASRCHTALANAVAGTGDDTITLHPLPQFFGRGYKAGLNGICKDLGLQHDPVELVQTVAAILRAPEIVERWAAGEAVFTPFAEALGLSQAKETSDVSPPL